MTRQESRALFGAGKPETKPCFQQQTGRIMKAPVPPSSAPGLWDKKSQSSGHRDQMCGHTPGKVAGRQETVKAEMNGLTPGLDRSPPPRWMGGQGGQSLKVFGRTRSFWGLSSPKIEMGGKPF